MSRATVEGAIDQSKRRQRGRRWASELDPSAFSLIPANVYVSLFFLLRYPLWGLNEGLCDIYAYKRRKASLRWDFVRDKFIARKCLWYLVVPCTEIELPSYFKINNKWWSFLLTLKLYVCDKSTCYHDSCIILFTFLKSIRYVKMFTKAIFIYLSLQIFLSAWTFSKIWHYVY